MVRTAFRDITVLLGMRLISTIVRSSGIEGRRCLNSPSGPNGNMFSRQNCCGNVVLRLRHAPSPTSQNRSSSRSLTSPLRALSCFHQQPQQRRALSAAPGASPRTTPVSLVSASRASIPRPAVDSVGRAQVGRYSSCGTRKLLVGPTRSNSRGFSAGAERPTTAGKERDGDHGGHDRRQFRAAPNPDQEDVIKQQEGQRQGQERGQERGEKFNKEGKRQRVVVGMSGGVDSSVVAMLLQQQGYEVVGVFMRNWDGQDETGSDVCTADADLEDARRVGMHLGIPVETVSFSRDYWNQVFEPSIQEFARCRTPNMDIACNRYIKFDAFRKYALGRMAADLVATGHYARTSSGPNGDWSKPVLLEAEDGNKDQTYFLCGVPNEGLAKVLFPLGGLTKPEVRDLAAKAGLPVARKRESMGVCFVGKRRSWAEFISQYLTPTPGKFVCVDTGDIVGEHRGVQLYTVGQKSHLDGMPEKYYVAGLDPDTNSVIVARGKDNPSLFARGLSVLTSEFNWIAGAPPAELSVVGPGGCAEEVGGEQATEAAGDTEAPPPPGPSAAEGEGGGRALQTKAQAVVDSPQLASRRAAQPAGNQREPALLRCDYRSRHRQALRPCTVEVVHAAKVGESEGGGAATAGGAGADPSPLPLHRSVLYVRFEEPARAIAPGQVVALYRDGVCLGGGPIFRAEGHCSPVLVRSPSPPPPPPPQKSGNPDRLRQRLSGSS